MLNKIKQNSKQNLSEYYIVTNILGSLNTHTEKLQLTDLKSLFKAIFLFQRKYYQRLYIETIYKQATVNNNAYYIRKSVSLGESSLNILKHNSK